MLLDEILVKLYNNVVEHNCYVKYIKESVYLEKIISVYIIMPTLFQGYKSFLFFFGREKKFFVRKKITL